VKIKLHLPQNGIEGGMLRERPVEIQIVEKGNKNELKYSRHEVYEAVQKLSVFTRLFGAFSEKYLDVICQEASDNIERSGFSKGQSVDGALSAENIKDYILREHISKVCISGSKKPRYVADEQFCRLEIADLVPKQIRRRTKSE